VGALPPPPPPKFFEKGGKGGGGEKIPFLRKFGNFPKKNKTPLGEIFVF